jgi:O-antigen/teichoic acid export membrane protein
MSLRVHEAGQPELMVEGPLLPAAVVEGGPGCAVAPPIAALAGRRIATNTLWNVLGLIAPMPLGLLVVPFLARRLGVDRFGVLSLAWAVIGYFTVFDLGLGRALTKLASERSVDPNRSGSLGALFWTTMTLLLAFSAVAGAVLAALSVWLVRTGLRIPGGMEAETLASLLLLSLVMPALILTSAPMALLAALGRFGELNLNRSALMLHSSPQACQPSWE